MTLILALSYSSRWEITKAARDIAEMVQNNKLIPDEIDDYELSEGENLIEGIIRGAFEEAYAQMERPGKIVCPHCVEFERENPFEE